MDILHLTYFWEVAVHKNFSKAAKTLHVSQPSISKGIKMLEEEWGEKLFHRRGRQVELTATGEYLLPKIRDILRKVHQLDMQISEIKGLPYGKLQIGIPPMLGASFLSPFINEFLSQYGQIELQIYEEGSNEIVNALTKGNLQVGFVGLPVQHLTNVYRTYIFNQESLNVILYKNHPLLTHEELTLDLIKDEKFILFNEKFSLYQIIMSAFQGIGVFPHIVCKSSNWDFVVEMVRNQLGIALLPERICKSMAKDDLVVLPLKSPKISWTLAMVWAKDGIQTTPTRLWIEYFTERMPEIKYGK